MFLQAYCFTYLAERGFMGQGIDWPKFGSPIARIVPVSPRMDRTASYTGCRESLNLSFCCCSDSLALTVAVGREAVFWLDAAGVRTEETAVRWGPSRLLQLLYAKNILFAL